MFKSAPAVRSLIAPYIRSLDDGFTVEALHVLITHFPTKLDPWQILLLFTGEGVHCFSTIPISRVINVYHSHWRIWGLERNGGRDSKLGRT